MAGEAMDEDGLYRPARGDRLATTLIAALAATAPDDAGERLAARLSWLKSAVEDHAPLGDDDRSAVAGFLDKVAAECGLPDVLVDKDDGRDEEDDDDLGDDLELDNDQDAGTEDVLDGYRRPDPSPADDADAATDEIMQRYG
jgi:hypothetical protein